MTMQKLFACFYIVCGIALVIYFGGSLIVQILGIMVGLFMIKQGFASLRTPMFFKADFRSFTNDKFK